MRNAIWLLFIIVSLSLAQPVHFALVNDCHAIMEPFGIRDSLTLEAQHGGYPRAVYIIDSLKTEYPNIVILHAGDVITGDFLSSMTVGRAMWDMWMAAGVQVFAVGNHEMEYGPYALDTALGLIDVPLVTANLEVDSVNFPNLAASIEPYRLLSVSISSSDTIKIAVFGTTTEESDMAGWTSPLDFSDPIVALESLSVPIEADAAIGLTHLIFNHDVQVGLIPWIDVVFGGHDHYNGDTVRWAIEGTDSTAIVKAGPYVQRVGHLTMEYIDGEGLRFTDWDNIVIDNDVPEEPTARALLDAYRDTLIANPRVGLDPYNTVAFRACSTILYIPMNGSSMGWNDSPLGNLVTDAYRAALGSDIAVDGRGTLRLPIFSGPVTYADLYRAMPLGLDRESGLNANLVGLDLTGAQLKQAIEITLFAIEFSPEVFPEFSGMRFSYNPDIPLFNKIDTGTWTISGEPWHSDSVYRIAASTMFIMGMDIMGFSYGAVDTSETTVYEALVSYCTDPSFVPVYSSDGRLTDLTVGIEEFSKLPDDREISVSPNPFNAVCRISFPQTISGESVRVYNLSGRIVDIIEANEISPSGEILWSPDADIPNGIYLIRFGEKACSAKAVLMK